MTKKGGKLCVTDQIIDVKCEPNLVSHKYVVDKIVNKDKHIHENFNSPRQQDAAEGLISIYFKV